MIIIALGANLPSQYGEAETTLQFAVKAMEEEGLTILNSSYIWKTAPVPISDQPWYKNAVVSIETKLVPQKLLQLLNKIEDDFGRIRTVRNAPRLLDLDIITYHDTILNTDSLTLPHPRMHERAFVLKPLEEIDNNFIHPQSHKDIATLISHIPDAQKIEKTETKVY